MNTVIVILLSALTGAALTWAVMRSIHKSELEIHRKEMENAEKLSKQAQENYERALKEMKALMLSSRATWTES